MKQIGENVIRIYTRGTLLEKSAAGEALKGQLDINLVRSKAKGSSIIDVELVSAEDVKKTKHRSIKIGRGSIPHWANLHP